VPVSTVPGVGQRRAAAGLVLSWPPDAVLINPDPHELAGPEIARSRERMVSAVVPAAWMVASVLE
jgi:hypothetical protein